MAHEEQAADRAKNEPQLGDTGRELKERCEAAGLEVRFETIDYDDDFYQAYAIIRFPEGRSTRRVSVEDHEIDILLKSDFESVRFLGDYAAYTDKSGLIEAALPRQVRPGFSLRDLPGVVVSSGDADADDDDLPPSLRRSWKLELQDPSSSVVLELGTLTDLGGVILPRGSSFRIRGLPVSGHDEALEALEMYANRLAFDLDVVFGANFRILRRKGVRRTNREEVSRIAVNFPRNNYALEPLKLYQYGRGADGLPLLEFLAYYQAIEYFFPYFGREQTMNDVRATLKNPSFDPNDDKQVGRLINLTGQARGLQTERDQLRATIRSCVAHQDFRDFLDSDQERLKVLTAKKPVIRGVRPLNVGATSDELRDQLAERIYTIRCRIVHSKQDGGGFDEVLLPGTREADSLHADIDVLQFVAQRVLIARAARA